MFRSSLCIHTEFHQPTFTNAFTGDVTIEAYDWGTDAGESAVEYVFGPNLRKRNFDYLSLTFTNSALEWLKHQEPRIYEMVIRATREYLQRFGAGNVLASPLNYIPLPSLATQDILLQPRWGGIAALRHYGHTPAGVSLPEFSADYRTLQAVVEAGYDYTILRSSQVEGLPTRWGAGPYYVRLPAGGRIKVFVTNDTLAEGLVEEISERGGAGYWAREVLSAYHRETGPLTLLCLDGAALGRYRMNEAYFMHYLLQYEAPAVGFRPITLDRYLAEYDGSVPEIGLLPSPPCDETTVQAYLSNGIYSLINQIETIVEAETADNQNMVAARAALYRAAEVVANHVNYQVDPWKHVFETISYALFLIYRETRQDLSQSFAGQLTPDYAVFFREVLAETHNALKTKRDELRYALP